MNENIFTEELTREATAEEISLIQKKERYLPQTNPESWEVFSKKKMLIFFMGFGLLLILFFAIQIVFDIGPPWQPDYRERNFGGIVAGVLIMLSSPVIIWWPESRKKSDIPIVTEKRIRPRRVLQVVDAGNIFMLMEVQEKKWLKLHESAFSGVDEKSFAREEVVLIYLKTSPIKCYGYGEDVPFIRETEESVFDWGLLGEGEIHTIPKLDSWFADLFPVEN